MTKRPVVAVVAALAALGVTLVLALGAAAGATAPRYELPDLRPIAPRNVWGPGTGLMPTLAVDAPFVIDGCFADERVRHGAQRCLRFDGIAANVGDGPFEVAYAPDASTTLAAAYQRLFRSDGSHEDRFAIRSEFHPTHAHFHIEDFYTARLWKATRRGMRMGARPVAGGVKNGFCPEDTSPVDGSGGGGHYSCVGDFEREEPTIGQVVGISAGWIDVYGYFLPDQFVEISEVRDGRYVLEIELDPNDVFVESNDANNAICVGVKLDGEVASLLDPTFYC